MNVSLTKARAHLNELVRRVEAGEEIVLTRRGRPVVRLVPEPWEPTRPIPTAAQKRAVMARIAGRAVQRGKTGPDAARSQDFLYDEDGLPG
nr:type II toxin-antitoxin system prevent-host-death family antitoxin [Devosia geojensis]